MKTILADIHDIINELEKSGHKAEASELNEVFIRVAQTFPDFQDPNPGGGFMPDDPHQQYHMDSDIDDFEPNPIFDSPSDLSNYMPPDDGDYDYHGEPEEGSGYDPRGELINPDAIPKLRDEDIGQTDYTQFDDPMAQRNPALRDEALQDKWYKSILDKMQNGDNKPQIMDQQNLFGKEKIHDFQKD